MAPADTRRRREGTAQGRGARRPHRSRAGSSRGTATKTNSPAFTDSRKAIQEAADSPDALSAGRASSRPASGDQRATRCSRRATGAGSSRASCATRSTIRGRRMTACRCSAASTKAVMITSAISGPAGMATSKTTHKNRAIVRSAIQLAVWGRRERRNRARGSGGHATAGARRDRAGLSASRSCLRTPPLRRCRSVGCRAALPTCR